MRVRANKEMITQMPRAPIGSVWSVLGYEDAAVVVLAGPFATNRGAPEYLIAPLYTGREPGFVWTSEDVRLEAEETGLAELRFAATWNARPVLDADLALQLGTLNEEATVAVRDAYWASLNDRPLGKSKRLGRPIRGAEESGATFQRQELQRWEPLSGRAFDAPEPSSAFVTARCGDVWTMTLLGLDALSREMASSESLVGSTRIEGIGERKAWLESALQLTYPAQSDRPTDLFAAVPGMRVWCEASYVFEKVSEGKRQITVEMAANSALADAA